MSAPTRRAQQPGRERARVPAPSARSRLSWRAVLAIVFALAFAWRLAYLFRLAASPLGGSLSEDSIIYWRWAGALLERGPWGHNPFFLGPLYPYLLAVLRLVVGDSVQAVLVVQAAAGAAAAVLLADAARRLTRPALGVAVGVMVALYEMAVFFDGLVLMESLLFLLEALLIAWVVRGAWPAARAAALAGLGGLIGVMAEARATSALLLLPAALLIARGADASARGVAKRLGLLLAGFALVALPVAVRNFALGGEWIPFTYNGGFNLYVGNNPEATGSFTSVTGTQLIGAALGRGDDGGVEADGREYLKQAEHLDLSPAASSAHWMHKAWVFAREHPGRVAMLTGRRMLMMWNRREYPQVENADEFRALAGPLGLPVVGSFLLLGPLALAGAAVAWKRGGAARFIAGYAIVATLAIAPFFVTDRYRHHLIPAAVVLAAVAMEQGLSAWRARDRSSLLRLLAALTAGLVIVNLPAPSLSSGKAAWGLAADLGTRWSERGRPDLAIAEFEKAIALERRGVAGRAAGTLGAIERANLHYNYANALARAGRGAEALPWYERAVGEAPDHALALRALADGYAGAGRVAEAESLYARLETKAGGRELALEGRGWLAARAGRLDQAERWFSRALEEYPASSAAWGALIRLQVQSGRLAAAESTLAGARRAHQPLPMLRAYEALLAVLSRRPEDARRALAEVPEQALASDPTLAEVVSVVKRLLEQQR